MSFPEDGDARRCPKHPGVVTSSPDGLHDTPCNLCEALAEWDDLGSIPELGPDFFEGAILTRPGESLIQRLAEERHCSKCGGELDGEGWCARYCTDDEPPK